MRITVECAVCGREVTSTAYQRSADHLVLLVNNYCACAREEDEKCRTDEQ